MSGFRDGEIVWLASIHGPQPAAIECTIVYVDGRPEIAYETDGRPEQHDLGGTPVFRSQEDALGEWYSEASYKSRELAEAKQRRQTHVDRVDSTRRRY